MVLIVLLGINNHMQAQSDTDTTYQYEIDEYWDLYTDEVLPINFIELGGLISIPQAAFKRNVPNLKGGGYIHYSRQFKVDSPLFIGGNIGYTVIDRYSSEVEREFDTVIEIWNGRTTSSFINFGGSAKYFIGKPIWIFDFYTQLDFGANWFFTNTNFSFPNSEETDSRYEKGDIVFSYGGFLGLMANIQDDYFLNVAFGYFPGLSANYYTEREEKDPILSSTIQAFDLKKSATDMIRIKIGVNFAF